MAHHDKLFWEAIDKVDENDLKSPGMSLEMATELSVWLHTEYQCKMEEADDLMSMVAKDETKPFDEKYKARELL